MASYRRVSRHPLLTVSIIAAAIVVVVLVALIAFGVLVLPSNGPAAVTIQSVHLKVIEGNTSQGDPWLEPNVVNYTSAEGYPHSLAPGATWTVVWQFINFDDVSHNVTFVAPSAPFAKPAVVPSLPYGVRAGDEGTLTMTLTAPSTPGVTYALTLTVAVDISPS
jgi:hypothetical protein